MENDKDEIIAERRCELETGFGKYHAWVANNPGLRAVDRTRTGAIKKLMSDLGKMGWSDMKEDYRITTR